MRRPALLPFSARLRLEALAGLQQRRAELEILVARTQATCRQVRVWIKVDTGLGRLGVPFQAAPEFIRRITLETPLEIAGLFSTLTENPVRDPVQVQRLVELGGKMGQPFQNLAHAT